MLRTTWGRFVLGAFVFAWLNASAQPCLMALEMAATPDVAPAHAEHGMHQDADQAGHEGAADCGHCPPVGAGSHQSPCATVQAVECNELSGANIDSRQFKLNLKDVPGMFALSQAPPGQLSFRSNSSMAPPPCLRQKFTDGPPLNIRYCVFLK